MKSEYFILFMIIFILTYVKNDFFPVEIQEFLNLNSTMQCRKMLIKRTLPSFGRKFCDTTRVSRKNWPPIQLAIYEMSIATNQKLLLDAIDQLLSELKTLLQNIQSVPLGAHSNIVSDAKKLSENVDVLVSGFKSESFEFKPIDLRCVILSIDVNSIIDETRELLAEFSIQAKTDTTISKFIHDKYPNYSCTNLANMLDNPENE